MSRAVVLSLAGLAALAVLATPVRAQFRGPFFQPAPRIQNRQAQFPFGVSPVSRPVVQPWFATQYNAGNIVAADIARNIATIGSGLASVPPWVFGYNPYVPAFGGGGFGPAATAVAPAAAPAVMAARMSSYSGGST
jgi:hypothetical protein